MALLLILQALLTALSPQQQLPHASHYNAMPATTRAAEEAAVKAEASAGPSTPTAGSLPPQPTQTGTAAAQPNTAAPLPSQAQAHGAPTRQYLNEAVTPHLLLATKYLAANRYASFHLLTIDRLVC